MTGHKVCGTCDAFAANERSRPYGACVARIKEWDYYPIRHERQYACVRYERKEKGNG